MAFFKKSKQEDVQPATETPAAPVEVFDTDFTPVNLDELASEVIDTPKYAYWPQVAKKFFSNKITIVMLVILIAVMGMAFIQPLFSGYNLNSTAGINDFAARYNAPSAKYWFGTDGDGKSLFDAIWAGAKTSMSISIISTLITTVIGTIVGAFWGVSPKMDRVMLEVYNVISNVPQLLIIMVLSYSFGAGFWNLIFAMNCTAWIGTAYGVRVQVMIQRQREYNVASKTLGTPITKIITRNILPYLTSYIVTGVSVSLPSFVSTEVFLSFLGVGLSANTPSLGRIIAKSATYMSTFPYLFWFPVAALLLITVPVYIVGQNLADATDPRTHM